jgi:hypothetical protein
MVSFATPMKLATVATALSLVALSSVRTVRADEVTPPPGTSGASNLTPTTPPSQPTPPTAEEEYAKKPSTGEFSFGSYGRVIAASDLRGGTGRQANIVSHGTRIDESTYAELQLERLDRYPSSYGAGVTTRVVSTLAIAGPLFHETGNFDAKIAVRNLYVEAGGIFFKGFTAWGGSRMYRGDDVYLLDWWPLDNLNTVGGGVRFALDTTSEGATSFALHAGLGRPLDPFSFQVRPSSSPTGFGSTDVVTLDRPRLIVSAKATHIEKLGNGGAGVKVVLYGETHSISRGNRTTESNEVENLPAESGKVYGLQLGLFTGKRDTFVNLFLRYATGIAAYGDKTVPSALSLEHTTAGAHEALAALSANYETGPFGLLAGAFVRAFRDASGNPYSRNTFNEGTLVLRPQVWLGEHVGIATEGSYQALASAGVDDAGNPIRASLWRFGLMPFLTPAGRGSFTRPQLRLIYAYTARSDGARALYAPDDRFARRSSEHFFGIGVEWWFNSSYR